MTIKATSDRQLVDAVLAGNAEAYRVLVERESSSVIALCASILRDPEEAQDVAQDAFVQAYRSIASYRGEGTFGAWIGRIARRKAVQRAGAARQRPDKTSIDIELAVRDNRADPEMQVLAVEHSAALRTAVSHLPEDQREVVAMRFYQDLSIDSISNATGVPVGTVKSRLHRALARLRDESDLRSVS